MNVTDLVKGRTSYLDAVRLLGKYGPETDSDSCRLILTSTVRWSITACPFIIYYQ